MSLIQMNISASILILCILLVRYSCLHILPKRTFVFLWGIALSRLLLPFSIPVSIDLGYFSNLTPLAQTDIQVAQNVHENFLYPTFPLTQSLISGISPLLIGYLMVVVILLTALLITYRKSYKEIQQSLPLNSNAFITDWMQNHKIMRHVTILSSDRISSPLTFGILRPKIVLPKNIDYNTQQLGYVLCHEWVHIKRLDVLWKLLSIIVVCLHWFNPLVWLMCILFNRDMEITCDEKVISMQKDEDARANYAHALIDLIDTNSAFFPFYKGFGKSAITERIMLIMKFKSISKAGMALAVVLMVGAVMVFISPTTSAIVKDTPANTSNVSATEEVKMLWPVPDYTLISLPYGFSFNNQVEHSGIDITGKDIKGKDVIAAMEGTVLYAENDKADYGNYIILEHEGELTTFYGHLSENNVKAGDSVKAGDVIGQVGSTGYSTGPHLHFEVKLQGETQDPELYMKKGL